MSAQYRVVAGLGAIILCLVNYGAARAEFTFLGPSPYLSAADSPFDLSGLGSTFFLEDFEDLENPPGILQFPDDGFPYAYGNLGASVDSDDGIIDGSGENGRSFAPNNSVEGAIFNTWLTEIEFDEAQLGFLPTAVGLVVADGAGTNSGFAAFDVEGNQAVFGTDGLQLSSQTTLDDRFLGVVNPDGIAKVVYFKQYNAAIGPFPPPPRVDHLQYGLVVPEPSDVVFVAIGSLLYWTPCVSRSIC